MRSLLLITSLSLGVKTFAFDLQPYTATYQFNLNQQITGTATRTLSKQENNHYRYQFNATAAIANANEVSEFIFDRLNRLRNVRQTFTACLEVKFTDTEFHNQTTT